METTRFDASADVRKAGLEAVGQWTKRPEVAELVVSLIREDLDEAVLVLVGDNQVHSDCIGAPFRL